MSVLNGKETTDYLTLAGQASVHRRTNNNGWNNTKY